MSDLRVELTFSRHPGGHILYIIPVSICRVSFQVTTLAVGAAQHYTRGKYNPVLILHFGQERL